MKYLKQFENFSRINENTEVIYSPGMYGGKIEKIVNGERDDVSTDELAKTLGIEYDGHMDQDYWCENVADKTIGEIAKEYATKIKATYKEEKQDD